METERLSFRFYVESDKADFVALFTDAAVMKYVGDGVMTREKGEAFWQKLFSKYYPNEVNRWAVFSTEDSRYVGHAGIYPRPTKKEDWEFVYFLNQKSWGRGYATEIAKRLIEFAFDKLNLTEFFTTVDDEHARSIHVLKKAGMKFLRHETDKDGQFSVYTAQNPKK